jgi:regulator of protease activity HflC (stomatin/prohibitin superfamily)
METTFFWVCFFVSLIALYVGWALIIVRPNQVAMRERLGKYRKVLFPGWHVLLCPGLIDRITVSKNNKKERIPILQKFPIPVFQSVDENGKSVAGEMVDFTNDTARITCNLWVQIGDPGYKKRDVNDTEPGRSAWTVDSNKDKLEDAVLRYVYSVGDAKERARAMVDNIIRHILQGMGIEEALKQKTDISLPDHEREELSQALEQMGMYLVIGTDPLTIGDIELSEKSVQLRQSLQTAEKEKKARETTAQGIRRSAEFIAKGFKDDGTVGDAVGADSISIAKALEYMQQQNALAALKGANLSLVHPDIGAATAAMMEMNSRGKNPRRNNT